MSYNSFGTIVLFRTEDLMIDSDNAFQPIRSDEELLSLIQINNPEVTSDWVQHVKKTIGNASVNAPLPFDIMIALGGPFETDRDIYRIATKNYKINYFGTALSQERFDVFSSTNGIKRKNFILNYYGDLENKNVVIFEVIKYGPGENSLKVKLDDQGYIATGVLSAAKGAVPFRNHNFRIQRPYSFLMPNSNNTPEEGSPAVQPVYNYYLKDYEKFYDSLTNQLGFDLTLPEEKSIPNYYYLISLLSDPSALAQVTDSSNKNSSNIGGLLKTITLNSNSILSNNVLNLEQSSGSERNSVVVVTPSFYKVLSEKINQQKSNHPFYNQINIPIQKDHTVIRDVLKQRGIYDQLQFKAGVMIKILNQAVQNGLNVKDILTRYDMFFTVPGLRPDGTPGSKFIDAKQKTLNPINTGIPYYPAPISGDIGSFAQNSQAEMPKLLELELPFQDAGQHFNFKVDNDASLYLNVGTVSNSDVYGSLSVPYGKTDAIGINLRFSRYSEIINNIFQVSSPLAFFSKALDCGDNPTGGQQLPVQSLLDLIYNTVKLGAIGVFDNRENYSEILFFEVQKIDAETNNLIQTFILPNDPDVGEYVTYIDSQIKYSKGYIYTIYAHTITIGNKLRRIEVEQTDGEAIPIEGITGGTAESANVTPTVLVNATYDNELDVKLVRVPYYNTTELTPGEAFYDPPQQKVTFNVDSPPIPPSVQFFPFKNINNKIGFWLNIGIGELEMAYISLGNTKIQEEALGKYMSISKIVADKLDTFNLTPEQAAAAAAASPILYSTDDFGGKIEVYRITTRPKTYTDFGDSKIADIDVEGYRSFVDDIVPNQDYYYTFKHVDVHGLPSNPTPVYHLKMVTSNSSKEDGAVRVGVENASPVLFNRIIPIKGKLDDKKTEKSFKKYLLIEPSLSQTYLNFDNFENGDATSGFSTANDIQLSPQELKIGKNDPGFRPVDGKKFKIRVTSKQTGRRIDLNVDFKNLSIIENYEE